MIEPVPTNEKEKPWLALIGGTGSLPSVESLVAMYKFLTGRDATPEEIADVEAGHAQRLAELEAQVQPDVQAGPGPGG